MMFASHTGTTSSKLFLRWGLDHEYILRHLLGVDATAFYAHPPRTIPARIQKKLVALERARARGVPMQYLVGAAWFFGLKFFVSRDVLIPRPETELLIERALAHKPHAGWTVIDVGTGSGAIAIACKKNMKGVRVCATDISLRALAVAKRNARTHHASITFAKSNLIENIPWPRTPHVLICANLPYLSTTQMKKLSPEVRHEPRRALHGGRDGLQLYQTLLTQIRTRIKKNQSVTLLAEIEPTQQIKFAALVRREFPRATTAFHRDLHGDVRCVDTTLFF